MTAAERFRRLPTAAKLLLILTAVLMPIGLMLAFLGGQGIRSAGAAVEAQSQEQSRAAAKAIESLLARNALAMRIAANFAFSGGSSGACERMQRGLAIAPAVSQRFELETDGGEPICAVGELGDTGELELVAPGSIRVRVSPLGDSVAIRAGVIGGMATGVVPIGEIQAAIDHSTGVIESLTLKDDVREMQVIVPPAGAKGAMRVADWKIGRGTLIARIGSRVDKVTTYERLQILLPLLMWIAAAVVAWLVVNRLLVHPLKRLERAMLDYEPGQGEFPLPERLGPSAEIEALRDSFARTIDRVERSESASAKALEGQRRLVREVHHRVKNNLQVVASLLNIHGRTANSPDVRNAYGAISRRVGALSVVHRNHFAEMEENRGIALRPLLSELAAELRVGAPEEARGLVIDLELDSVNTTQDVAVAIAFLITEIVEFAMLNAPNEPVEIAIRRTSELTSRLKLSNRVLVPDNSENPEKIQFERIISGLAKQLRSVLERKMGTYSIEFPVFPPG